MGEGHLVASGSGIKTAHVEFVGGSHRIRVNMSPDVISKSETKTVAGQGAVRGRNGTVPAGRHHSRTDADENRLGPGLTSPDRLMGNTLQQQRVNE